MNDVPNGTKQLVHRLLLLDSGIEQFLLLLLDISLLLQELGSIFLGLLLLGDLLFCVPKSASFLLVRAFELLVLAARLPQGVG